ncbi:MAG TPA: right-handed parallel beta-helix repeat-containing protein [Novosphingobium sp.]|nr:right-handed parallel beta-helix repeat-containing protein [Novosphingobium sp.]
MKKFIRFVLAPAVLIAAITTLAPAQTRSQTSQGPGYLVVETGRTYARLQEAVDAIGPGTGTIRFASFRFADCAVQGAGDILYQAEVPGMAVLDGVACEGKAALVLRGRAARIEGLVFANIRVPDKNGAGIRLEKGDLTVSQAWFRDSEQGILTANGETGTIAVDKSTFTRLGTCEGWGGCSHSIYVGDYGALTVTRSRFEAGRGGHYVKTRTPRVAVINSSFDDSGGKGTNYMIDLSAGATGEISGNWFVQGYDKENYSAFIAVAPEGRINRSAGLTIAGNDARFAPGIERQSTFVADWSGEALAIGQNTLGAGLKRYEKR